MAWKSNGSSTGFPGLLIHWPTNLLMLCLWMSLTVPPATGEFWALDAAARPVGLGGAYIALAEGAIAPVGNPAGLGQLTRPEALAAYTVLFPGLEIRLFDGRLERLGYHLVGYAHPFRRTGIGLVWALLDSTLYEEHTFFWGQAVRVSPRLSLGAALRLIHQRLGESPYLERDPDLAYRPHSQTGATLDFGALFAVLPRVRVGIHVTNLRPLSLHWLDSQRLPVSIALGLAYHGSQNVLLLDGIWREYEPLEYRVGGERWFWQRRFALRMGSDFQRLMLGGSIRQEWRRTEWQIDYAWQSDALMDSAGSHRLALTARF